MFCRKCGTQLLEGSAYCTACGTAVVLPPEQSKEAEDASSNAASLPPEQLPAQDSASEPSAASASRTDDLPPEEEPKGALKINGKKEEPKKPASLSEKKPEESAAPEAKTEKAEMPPIIVGVPVIVVTEPVIPGKEKSKDSEHFFSAAGNLSGPGGAVHAPASISAPAPVHRPAASLGAPSSPPSAPPVLNTERPVPPETGGYVDKVSDRPMPSSAPAAPPAMPTYGRPAYSYEPTSYPDELEEETKKRNIFLWIIIGILAIGLIGAAFALLFVPDVHNAVFGEPDISFSDTAMQLDVGEKTNLNDVLTLEHVDENKIGWKSSDPAVATVRDGKVEAVGAGVCEITVYAKQDEDLSDTIQLTVGAGDGSDGNEVTEQP